MKKGLPSVTVSAYIVVLLTATPSAQRKSDMPVTVRPSMLAQAIEELAGSEVNVRHARVVGVFNPRVLVVDTATLLRPMLGRRDRVLVFVGSGALKVPSRTIVGSTVRISGVARTLIGVQVTAEVPWPTELSSEMLERLEIRAAVMATSVRTAEGIELTSPESFGN